MFCNVSSSSSMNFAMPLTVTSYGNIFEPPLDKTNKIACAPSEDSDQPRHPPSLIRVFAVRMTRVWVLTTQLSAQRRPWSDWADAQAELCLRWAHSHFVAFIMLRLICFSSLFQYCQFGPNQRRRRETFSQGNYTNIVTSIRVIDKEDKESGREA